MWRDFKAFIARGNVVDLAVAVVVGAAFGAVVTGFVKDLVTPLLAIPGKVTFSGLHFTVNHSTFLYGDFLNLLISFVTIAAAIFFFVVKPINALQARRARGENLDPTTRACPECLSDIPYLARRCAFCTAEVPPAAEDETAAAEPASS